MEPKAGEANPIQRFRVVLSDIRNFIQTMIATSVLDMTEAGKHQLTMCSCQRNRHFWSAQEGLDSTPPQVQPATCQGQEVCIFLHGHVAALTRG